MKVYTSERTIREIRNPKKLPELGMSLSNFLKKVSLGNVIVRPFESKMYVSIKGAEAEPREVMSKEELLKELGIWGNSALTGKFLEKLKAAHLLTGNEDAGNRSYFFFRSDLGELRGAVEGLKRGMETKKPKKPGMKKTDAEHLTITDAGKEVQANDRRFRNFVEEYAPQLLEEGLAIEDEKGRFLFVASKIDEVKELFEKGSAQKDLLVMLLKKGCEIGL